jgi:hypothetical protein
MTWQGSKPCSKRIGSGFPDPVRFVFVEPERNFPGTGAFSSPSEHR